MIWGCQTTLRIYPVERKILVKINFIDAIYRQQLTSRETKNAAAGEA
jgi:hypothetical protein